MGRSRKNNSLESIKIEDIKSASIYVDNDSNARLNYLCGMWANEFCLRSEEINEGKKVLESRVGNTGPYLNPFFQ